MFCRAILGKILALIMRLITAAILLLSTFHSLADEANPASSEGDSERSKIRSVVLKETTKAIIDIQWHSLRNVEVTTTAPSPSDKESKDSIFWLRRTSKGWEIYHRGAFEKTNEQKLIEAAFTLNVSDVRLLLALGADVNADYGIWNKYVFGDPWRHGYSPMGSQNWTPLLAVAHSARYPRPPHEIENTTADLEWARKTKEQISTHELDERQKLKLEIAHLLIRAGAQLDSEDGVGNTALAESVGTCSELALLLIHRGANVNTKTGIYIDGPGDVTPLHCATSDPEIVAALIAAGAKLNVVNTSGESPLHAAARSQNVESVRLLLKAGANPKIKDHEGRTPIWWSSNSSSAAAVEIHRLLQRTKAK